MSENKWKFAAPDPNDPSPEKVERGGMLVVGIIGLILLAGGLFFVWKTGAYSFDFFGNGSQSLHSRPKTEIDILFVMNLPWIAGACMVIAAVKRLLRK